MAIPWRLKSDQLRNLKSPKLLPQNLPSDHSDHKFFTCFTQKGYLKVAKADYLKFRAFAHSIKLAPISRVLDESKFRRIRRLFLPHIRKAINVALWIGQFEYSGTRPSFSKSPPASVPLCTIVRRGMASPDSALWESVILSSWISDRSWMLIQYQDQKENEFEHISWNKLYQQNSQYFESEIALPQDYGFKEQMNHEIANTPWNQGFPMDSHLQDCNNKLSQDLAKGFTFKCCHIFREINKVADRVAKLGFGCDDGWKNDPELRALIRQDALGRFCFRGGSP